MSTNSLVEERQRRLAEKNGWTINRAKGYYEGEATRAKGDLPSQYAMVGTDEHCRGYREGYFGRQAASTRSTGRVAVSA